MANEFDPYREALVMETATIWPEDYDDLESSERWKIEERLHSEPQKASDMVYLRTHTGFCRQITVTSEDLDRVR